MTFRVHNLPSPLLLGFLGSLVLAVASFGAGAVRTRGGILESLGMSAFAFGHGAGLANALFWVGILLLLAAWLLLGQRYVLSDRTGATLAVVSRTLFAWCAPLLLAAPMLSRDVYSYLMQGAMLRDGFDPYTQGAAVNPGPFLLEVSHDWRNTTTPYGPLHLWIGQGITTVVGDNVTLGVVAYKIISLLGFAAIAWAVIAIARQLGGNPALALWLGVANPVMILHMVGGMHNESLMVGLVSIGLLLSLRARFLPGVALIAIAVSLKATAAIALPFVVWIAVHRYGASIRKKVLAFFLAGALFLAETLAVVAAITWASGASWGWLSEISGNSKVINPLALPTLIAEIYTPMAQLFVTDFPYNFALNISRIIFMPLMLVGLILVWWLFRRNPREAIIGTTAAYQVAFLFNSVTLPWYYASVLSLIGTFNPPRWLIKLSIGATIVLTLAFNGSGNHQLYNVWWMAPIIAASWWLAEKLCQNLPARMPSLERDGEPLGPTDHAEHLPDVPAAKNPL